MSEQIREILAKIVATEYGSSLKFSWHATSLKGQSLVLYTDMFWELAHEAIENSNKALEMLSLFGGNLDLNLTLTEEQDADFPDILAGCWQIKKSLLDQYMILVMITKDDKSTPESVLLSEFSLGMVSSATKRASLLQKILLGLE